MLFSQLTELSRQINDLLDLLLFCCCIELLVVGDYVVEVGVELHGDEVPAGEFVVGSGDAFYPDSVVVDVFD